MTEARLLIEKAHYEMGVFERTSAMTSRQLIQLAETQIAEIERLRWALEAIADGEGDAQDIARQTLAGEEDK